MSLELQFRALYRLYYKRNEREAFLREGKPPAGIAAAALKPLRALEPARLRRVVDLHAADIGHQWYTPRVPATWLALQALLEAPEAEVVHRLTECDAFESRINDDSNCRALAGFVDTLQLNAWLPELLRYERLLGCAWPEGRATRLERFAYDVSGIRESLVGQRICPTNERSRITHLLLHKAANEVRELRLRPGEAEAVAALLQGRRPKGRTERARAALREIQAG